MCVRQVLDYGMYSILYTPRPLGCLRNSYKMERIDDSEMLLQADLECWPALVEELARFYADMGVRGVVPNDFELYKQVDGRVALIDFDKFVVRD
jgi:hypothetical protein